MPTFGEEVSRLMKERGLVQQALYDAGFNVEMRQYNRPPTDEQKRRPWMDRFELPDTRTPPTIDGGESGESDLSKLAGQCVGHRHTGGPVPR